MKENGRKRKPVRFYMDEGTLSSFAERQIKENFPDLEKIRIMYSWRNVPKKGEGENGIILALAHKIPPKYRDLMKFDVGIEVCKETWNSMSREDKRQLLYHELSHVEVLIDDEGEIKADAAGRTMIRIVPHDVVVKTFKKELEKFGVAKDLKPTVSVLVSHLKNPSGEVKEMGEKEVT